MNDQYTLRPIAYLRGDLKEKFGIPRQAGLVEELESYIEFEPEFRQSDALRGIEGFSHLWLIWQFSGNLRDGWSPTVRPPRLGGNERMGVFATRSPFRPNALGLSCVKLIRVEWQGEKAPRLLVSGADLMDGTPIFDIKPYLPYADAHPEALSGFAQGAPEELEVVFDGDTEKKVPAEKLPALRHVLAADPRPRYHKDPRRIYIMDFADMSVSFRVEEGRVIVEEIKRNLSSAQGDRAAQHRYFQFSSGTLIRQNGQSGLFELLENDGRWVVSGWAMDKFYDAASEYFEATEEEVEAYLKYFRE